MIIKLFSDDGTVSQLERYNNVRSNISVWALASYDMEAAMLPLGTSLALVATMVMALGIAELLLDLWERQQPLADQSLDPLSRDQDGE